MIKLKYFVFSDQHMGHRNNKSICKNTIEYFMDNKEMLSKCDIIFTNGDEYDHLLPNNSDENIEVVNTWIYIAMFCKTHNIKLRALEGTPSHSFKQMRLLETTLDKYKINIDFKYYSEISIEYIKEYDINVLYIPDEMNHNAADTFKYVKELMISKGISKVDLTMMHGQFHYQLPVTSEVSHNENDYLSITRYYIHIGHVHKFSVFKRIIANGSTDRISHGEEEDKGAVFVTIYNDDKMLYKFVVNKLAITFKTVRFKTEDIKELEQILIKELKGLRPKSFVRLMTHRDNPILKTFKVLKKRLSKFNVSKDYTDGKNKRKAITESIKENIEFPIVEIKPDNIIDLVHDKLKDKDIDVNILSLIDEEISNVIKTM